MTGLLLKAAHINPSLPLDKDGKQVDAPDFGENLYQDVGLASNRSGYSFDGKQWRDDDDRKIKPPHSGKPVVPIDPNEKGISRSGFSKATTPLNQTVFSTESRLSVTAMRTSTGWLLQFFLTMRPLSLRQTRISNNRRQCRRMNNLAATWLPSSNGRNFSSKSWLAKCRAR
ncbi:hypothetical protein ACFOHQ_16200 [Xanthomonas fragariae]